MRILALIFPLLLASCILNVFKGPDDFTRNHLARHLKEGIDTSVEREVAKLPPNGYLTKPYSRQVWNQYWNGRINGLYDLDSSSFDGSYRGPSGQQLIDYFIRERRSRGLPDIELEPRNRVRLHGSQVKQWKKQDTPW